MELPVYNAAGVEVRRIEVNDLLFAVPMNTAVVHQALVRQHANARQGTHASKTRGDVSGGGKKPWRQKGTGRARAGSRRSPIWRGGGVAFGPHPRSYRQAMPIRMRRLALRCTLAAKAREGELVLIDSFGLMQPKAAEMNGILRALGVTSSVLLVTPTADDAVILSARNLPRVKTLPAPQLNVGDVLSHQRLVMTVEAVRRAEEIWARDKQKGGK
ncbi:MAG: 50S ribosomal protein L4 [Chloroflexi bacterium]|nr:50S ribosomal protein L4 [Chloroflexota bacterium]